MTRHPILPIVRPLLVAVALVGALAQPLQAAGRSSWEVARIDGREYVTARSIQQFYGFTRQHRQGKSVFLENRKVEMKLTIEDRTCLMNGVKFVFSHPVVEQDGRVCVSRMDLAKLIDPVLRPNYIKNAGDFRSVILDPGHGGRDTGATNDIGREADYNLSVARRLKAQLEGRGFRVLMTRDRDTFLTLQDRVDYANSVRENAIFISIHFNSGGSHARGIETFTLSPPGIAHYGRDFVPSDNQRRLGNMHDSANMALATSVHGSVLRRLARQSLDRGIKRARFDVLTGVRHPAILLEGGFMTHPFESKLIHSPVYQDTLALGVADAVMKYRFAVSIGRPEPAYRR